LSSNKVLVFLLVLSTPVFANKAADEFYSAVERHLRSLPSLEIGYRATGPDFPQGGLEGRLAFQRPDGFYHDTPEWTQCEHGAEQWRYLKEQQTLLLENADGRSEWSPESVLLSLDKDLVPYDVISAENGDTVLVLDAVSAQVTGQVEMTFAAGKRVPKEISFKDDDGNSSSRYEILMWHESVKLDSALFLPPDVPAENKIDFRTQ
jgi:hypothetical protein